MPDSYLGQSQARMKVLARRLTDADREILFESNRTGRRVLVAALHGCAISSQLGRTECKEPMQAVGTVKGWNHESVQIGGWSFTTSIPWLSAVKVWWRDEAPSEDDVAAILAEFEPLGDPHA